MVNLRIIRKIIKRFIIKTVTTEAKPLGGEAFKKTWSTTVQWEKKNVSYNVILEVWKQEKETL